MKIKKLTLLLTSLGIVPLLLTSCGPSIDDFEKKAVIKEFNAKEMEIVKNDFPLNATFYGDYYIDNNEVYNIHTSNKLSSLDNKEFEKVKLDEFDVYRMQDSLNGNTTYYDSFGASIIKDLDVGKYELKYNKTGYLLIGNDSEYAISLNLEKENEQDKKLYLLRYTYFSLNMESGSNKDYVIVSLDDDTTFSANNVYSIDDPLLVPCDEFIIDRADVQFLNDTEAKITLEEGYRIMVYTDDDDLKGSTNTTPVDYDYNDSEGLINYTMVMSIQLNRRSYAFNYQVKEASLYSNDFSFVYNDKYYKAVTTHGFSIKDDNPNYVPISYLKTNDDDMAILLVKKILDDGQLSNSYYTMVMDNRYKLSDFKDETRYFSIGLPYELKNHIYFLDPGDELVALNSHFALILDIHGTYWQIFDAYTQKTLSLGKHKYLLATANIINDMYYLYSYENRSLALIKASGNETTIIPNIADRNYFSIGVYATNNEEGQFEYYYKDEIIFTTDYNGVNSKNIFYVHKGIMHHTYILNDNNECLRFDINN